MSLKENLLQERNEKLERLGKLGKESSKYTATVPLTPGVSPRGFISSEAEEMKRVFDERNKLEEEVRELTDRIHRIGSSEKAGV